MILKLSAWHCRKLSALRQKNTQNKINARNLMQRSFHHIPCSTYPYKVYTNTYTCLQTKFVLQVSCRCALGHNCFTAPAGAAAHYSQSSRVQKQDNAKRKRTHIFLFVPINFCTEHRDSEVGAKVGWHGGNVLRVWYGYVSLLKSICVKSVLCAVRAVQKPKI